MQPKKKDDWNSLNRRIRATEKEAGMTREDHKALVQAITGSESLKGASVTSMKKVLAKLNAHSAPKHTKSSKPYVRMVWALWNKLVEAKEIEAKDTRAALVAYVNRLCKLDYTGAGQLEWLLFFQANKVIETLKKWHQKAGI